MDVASSLGGGDRYTAAAVTKGRVGRGEMPTQPGHFQWRKSSQERGLKPGG